MKGFLDTSHEIKPPRTAEGRIDPDKRLDVNEQEKGINKERIDPDQRITNQEHLGNDNSTEAGDIGKESEIEESTTIGQDIVEKQDNPNRDAVETDKIKEADNNRNLDISELSDAEKQKVADTAAQEYNEKTRPYERAVAKGLEGITETPNGGVSFRDSPYIYKKEDGTKCIVKIEATGSRPKDFDLANNAAGLKETPEGYVWHHVDDYDVKKGTITLELVKDEAHDVTKPHSGGCAQYDAVNGPSYNPPKKS